MELNAVLKAAVDANASDIHLKAGLPPIFRSNSALRPYKAVGRLTPDVLTALAEELMNSGQRDSFERNREIDMGYGVAGLGRFRLNIFQQRGSIGMVFRVIPTEVKTVRQLALPKVVETLAEEQRGLILVTGTTGSGKSTTLAAMIDHINGNRTSHVMTIEDPIEFLHRDKKSIINQREVGFDTHSFSGALKSALRQDPDVILVGEMRDFETIETALVAAETGHLVLSTLHTVDAGETINRIISVFPPYQQKQVRLQLASIIKGIVSQRLVNRADGKGRVPAVEVMVSTSRIRECIESPEKTKEITTAISEGYTTYKMQTFDQSLLGLLQAKHITYKEALRQSSNPDDLALKVSGISSTHDNRWEPFEGQSGKK
ncbi:MAG: type IV pili twitching motility protein PilT [Deltaproteobacteria bacterium]|nr:MAG: type IV pili twitching motility protein PilT [Deltaproteobacteria bacterium]